ncbi:MAG: porin family protein [Saprospiraceae bacterium]|nr:porin family protein [Saprospiraceae bacterium]
MKKVTYIIATISIFASTLSFAQVNIGIKGGLNFSDARADVFIDAVNNAPSTYTSFVYGAVAEVQVSKGLSFQPELLFTQKGFTVDEGTSLNVLGLDIPVGARATTSINYIETPLLAKLKLGTGNVNFYGIAGPSLGYATSATIQPKVTLLIDFNLPEVNVDLSDNIYNRTDISGILGAGAEYKTGTGKLFTDLRYQHSFSNIISDPIADISVKNSGYQFSAGYIHSF